MKAYLEVITLNVNDVITASNCIGADLPLGEEE